MNMYFIAVVAPADINKQVIQWKNLMKEKFGCVVALRAPAHITLIPPFWLNEELENELANSVIAFSATEKQFTIRLQNFSCFAPRTIFVDVQRNLLLTAFKKRLEQFLLETNRYGIKAEQREFHPHVTIATRDLFKKSFYEAWEIFKKKGYGVAWTVGGVSILRHDKKNWDVIFTSQLSE